MYIGSTYWCSPGR